MFHIDGLLGNTIVSAPQENQVQDGTKRCVSLSVLRVVQYCNKANNAMDSLESLLFMGFM